MSKTLPLLDSPAICWSGDRLRLLDQRLLPTTQKWTEYDHARGVAQAIRDMVVRGAPAIGICAAYGIALSARKLGSDASAATLAQDFQVLADSRPTAVNLAWALKRLEPICQRLSGVLLGEALADEACCIHQEDQQINQRIGALGAALLPDGARVYTHCNAGALATGGYGTALGIIRTAWTRNRLSHVYAGETRPWFQGSRLTAWELAEAGIPTTVLIDSAAAQLMAKGQVDAVITGADRIAANGDTANKIGTYSLAILARYHGIPFIVAAPTATIDRQLRDGSHIPIEERDACEVQEFAGHQLTPDNIEVANPVFDVTPASLISALVTERGVLEPPNMTGISMLFGKS